MWGIRKHETFSRLPYWGGAVAALFFLSQPLAAATLISGNVTDLNGNPVAQAQVIFSRGSDAIGANIVTVFSDTNGQFTFPDSFPENAIDTNSIGVRSLDHRLLHQSAVNTVSGNDTQMRLTIILAPADNQIAVAPASAWLTRLPQREQQSEFVMACIDCHQVPASEQRDYAAAIDDLHAADPAQARLQSWNSIAKYMNYLSAWEFSRGRRADEQKLDAEAVYGVDNESATAATLARIFDDRLDHISGYSWGAPIIANAKTTIWEYEIPHPNAIREALMLGDPAKLWVADVSSNNMIAVDVATGAQEIHPVPSDLLMSPHSLHRGSDGSLWITPLFNSIVAHLNPASGEWRTWKLRTEDGKNPGIHDLSFGWEHELLTDAGGNVWFSDIGNNAVGYFNPVGGNSKVWTAPPSPGRERMRTALYGLSMNSAHNEVWYSQLGNGTFGGFNMDTKEFIGPFQLPDPNAGPRRISMSNDDMLYLALYGSGQLAEFDTRSQKMVGIYDLPDTASAPYATTWDPVRKVVWIATSNGDVIYRFNPQDKSFGVLPLPRERAFLRMIDLDPRTGVLITSYANIVDIVQGPRMALIIDPGDNVYPERFTPGSAKGAVGMLP